MAVEHDDLVRAKHRFIAGVYINYQNLLLDLPNCRAFGALVHRLRLFALACCR